jgi:hypothetical protein
MRVLLASLALPVLTFGCFASSEPSPGESPPPFLSDCEPGAWCWVAGTPVFDLTGGPGSPAYAVGAQGLLVRWTGDGWERLEPPERGDLRAVYAAAPNDLWVAGTSELHHFDGDRWSAEPHGLSPEPESFGAGLGLSGARTGDLFRFDRDTVERLGGGTWQDETPESLYAALDLHTLEVGDAAAGTEGPSVTYLAALTSAGPTSPPRLRVLRFVPGATGEGRWRAVGEAIEPIVASAAIRTGEGGSPELVLRPRDVRRLEGGRWIPKTDVDDLPGAARCSEQVAQPDGTRLCLAASTLFRSRPGSRWKVSRTDRFGDAVAPGSLGDLAPSLWAGEAERAWSDGVQQVLRIRATGDESRDDFVLERTSVSEGRFSPVREVDGVREVRTPFPVELRVDLVPGEAPWLLRDEGVYRVVGDRLRRIDTREEWSWVRIAARAGDQAWALASREDDTFVLVRCGESGCTAVQELEAGAGTSPLRLSDLDVEDDGTLWMTGSRGVVGRTEGTAVLFRRDPNGRIRERELWASWGGLRLAIDGDQLWIGEGREVLRLPAAVMEGGAAEPQDRAALKPTDATPQIWIGERGVWLTGADSARFRPRP